MSVVAHTLDTGNAIPKFGGMGMGEETKAVFLTQEELYTLHAAFEVLVKGEGTYMMLRLPKVVKTHRGLFEKFCDALGWEAWG